MTQHYNDYYSETQQSLEFCFLRKLLCSYLELAFKVGWENQKKPKIEAGKLDRMGAWPRVLRISSKHGDNRERQGLFKIRRRRGNRLEIQIEKGGQLLGRGGRCRLWSHS